MWQKPVNAIACVWVFFISVILMFPTVIPITASNMNYAIAVAGAIASFALTWWYLGARKTYSGPRTRHILLSAEGGEKPQIQNR